jgi:predicted esterase
MITVRAIFYGLCFLFLQGAMIPLASAAQHDVELVRVSLGQTRGASDAADLSGVNYIYDDVAGTITQTSALTTIGFQISPVTKLFNHRLRGVVFDVVAASISATGYECVEGNFGDSIAASLCTNTTWGDNFIPETTSDYTTIPSTRIIGGDDEADGAQQQLSSYAATLTSFDGTTVIIESPAWTANPEHRGMQLEFVSTASIPRVDVIEIRALGQTTAEADLITADLIIGTVTIANHPSVPVGQVISQNPSACATCVLPGSAINFVVSLGPIAGGTASDQLAALRDNVSTLDINPLLDNTLKSYLDRIILAVDGGDYSDAKTELGYFSLVVDWVSGWLMPLNDGHKLMFKARKIINRLDKALKAIPPSGLNEFNSTSGDRSYYIEIPADYSATGELKPILFMLHGTGGTHERFLSGGLYAVEGDDLRAKVGNDAIIIYPNALPNENGVNQWDQNYDFDFFRDLLTELGSDLVFDENRIFVTGHSSGAGFSYELGCQLGDVIRAIAPSAGALKSEACIGSVAVMHVQSENDTVVFPGITEPTRNFWVLYNGFDTNISSPGITNPCVDYSLGNSLYPVQWCMHEDTGRGGHQWWTKAGAIWDFFATLPIAEPTIDHPPGGGNDRVNEQPGTTLSFTVEYPSSIGEVWKIAAVLYPAGTQQPIFTGPIWFLNINIDPGDALPGTQQSYEVDAQMFDPSTETPLPGTYSVSIAVYVVGGGYPTPIADIDHIQFQDVELIDKTTPIVIDGVFVIEPVQ